LTIIFQVGKNFWIEYHLMSITLPDAAGLAVSGTTNLDRAGSFLGSSVMIAFQSNNDNTQAMAGAAEIRTGAAINFGDTVASIQIRQNKQIGTAGATAVTYHVLVFMRGEGKFA